MHLHAGPYERSAGRRGYRNGYKPCLLNARVGTLRDRSGGVSASPIPLRAANGDGRLTRIGPCQSCRGWEGEGALVPFPHVATRRAP